MKKAKAFTLIELLVVVTIIGLLTAIASVSYTQFLKQSRDAKRKADIEEVRAALEMYRSNNSVYPNGDWSSLSALRSPTVYIQSLPTDPKGASYYYLGSDSDYTIAASLESGGVTCVAGQCGGNCNYCLGPYGQK